MIVFVSILVLWIISLCLHEYSHARVAFAGGDTSVVEKGYLTMNPLRYINGMTSIVLPLIILMIGGVPLPGGAVYIDTSRLRNKHWDAAVSAAGPAANLALLVLCGVFFLLGLHELEGVAGTALVPTIGFFAYLMAFASVLNLLPIPGLDGFGIIAPYLPEGMRRTAYEFSTYGMFLLLILIVANRDFRLFISDTCITMTTAVGVPIDAIQRGAETFFEHAPRLF